MGRASEHDAPHHHHAKDQSQPCFVVGITITGPSGSCNSSQGDGLLVELLPQHAFLLLFPDDASNVLQDLWGRFLGASRPSYGSASPPCPSMTGCMPTVPLRIAIDEARSKDCHLHPRTFSCCCTIQRSPKMEY
jgi:hypothetical protein